MSRPLTSRQKLALGVLGSLVTVLGGSLLYLHANSDDIPRDFSAIRKLLKLKSLQKAYLGKPNWATADFWLEAVNRSPKKVALAFLDGDQLIEYTYEQAEQRSNQVANVLRANGVKKGDVVVLMMDNRPEFIISWLAITKVGGVAALINTNLRGKPLIHSLETSKANVFLIGHEHCQAAIEARHEVETSPEGVNSNIRADKWFVQGAPAEGFLFIDPIVDAQPTDLVGGLCPDRTVEDALCYIYTSGTTGLPKASIITHLRYILAGSSFATLYDMHSADVYYCALPFYHSAGGIITVCCSIFCGMKLVFRKKFSASNFWKDCADNGVTIIQYIGELCAYLLDKPVTPQEKQHNVRLAVGNGLRPDIWEKFQTRFAIPVIGEFYAATEGNANLSNFVGKPGAVGFIPRIIENFYITKLIKYDVEEDRLVRDSNGFCVEAKPNEIGHLVGRIVNGEPISAFKGYTNKEATEKKILRDAFEKGDAYFMTGDLLKKDTSGFYYFVDRIGDTFRWKGENVATSEVEISVRAYKNVREVTVYGVQVPHTGGRAGMAVIVPASSVEAFDLPSFFEYTKKELPAYAIPIFLRFQKEIEITGTFKHMKATLRQEGFNPNIIQDPLFIRNPATKTYEPITRELFDTIQKNSISAKL